MSPAEFIKKANPKNQSDQAMVLAYYLEKVRTTSSFTSTEIAELAREIKRPFANASDLVAKLSCPICVESSSFRSCLRWLKCRWGFGRPLLVMGLVIYSPKYQTCRTR
jgi:hypothetical protein